MRIILSKYAGFCEGVTRAYRIALRAVAKRKPVYILGDLVHNRDVVKKFEGLGIKRIKTLKGLKSGSTVVITAHGSSPKIYDEAKVVKLRVVDTTCPWVKKAQRIASEFANEGRQVIIVGDRGHPEVVGLLGWAGPDARVVENVSQLRGIKLKGRAGVIAQTTQSEENFNEVVRELRIKVPDLKVSNTICGATSKRQCSAVDLAREVDMVLVIGDFKSANTKRLVELILKEGVEAHQVQNGGELKFKWLKGKKTIGITAGASTPDWIIKRVIDKIRHYAKEE